MARYPSRRRGRRAIVTSERRAFIDHENEHLGRFLEPAAEQLIGWRRRYRCECGFTCTAPGDLFDHTRNCEGAE